MGIRNNGEAEERASSDPRLEQATGSICSLNEAWLNMLDRCFIDSPLSEVILPLMPSAFLAERRTRFSCWTRGMAVRSLPILLPSSGKAGSRYCRRLRETVKTIVRSEFLEALRPTAMPATI
jgi:hypothetical protein